MSICLYPILKDGITINKLVNIKINKYNQFQKLQILKESQDEEYYDIIDSDDDLFILDKISDCGWGHFVPLPEMINKDGFIKAKGEIRDFAKIKILLENNGINYTHVKPFIEGVRWS